mgnify:CR=1 FL=1
MIAIFETGGKQYIVSKGDKIQIEKLAGEKGETLTFDKVLFTSDNKSYELGKPFIKTATVEGKILKQARAKKIHILKYKAKSKYRKKQGHRQNYTEVEITKV